MMDKTYNYQWREMRRIAWLVLLGYLIWPIGFAFNHYLIDPKDRPSLGLWIFFGTWAVFIVWISQKYRNWPCPRCGRPWQKPERIIPWGWFGDLFLRHKCPHCGLALPELKFGSA